MIAIETHYMGPTDKLPARIAATTCNNHRLVMTYGELDIRWKLGRPDTVENAHRTVAEALAAKMEWTGELVCGSTKRGFVFVFKS